MPTIVPGYTTEQKVSTVSNNDVAINAEIDAQAADSWLVSSLTLFNDDTDVIILFSRTIAAAA